jgi:hypothetical protein
MWARKTRYNIPELKSAEESEAYFESAIKWKGGQMSKSRIGSAMQAAGVKATKVDEIFEFAAELWEEISERSAGAGLKKSMLAGFEYRSENLKGLRKEVDTRLRSAFQDVFGNSEAEGADIGEEQKRFIFGRAVGMVVYRTWHDWSRKVRKRDQRRAGKKAPKGKQTAEGVQDQATRDRSITAMDGVEDNNLPAQGTTDGQDRDSSSLSSEAFRSSTSPAPGPTYCPHILEVYSQKDDTELLRIDVKHLLAEVNSEPDIDMDSEPDIQAAATPSFEKLETQLREHPLAGLSELSKKLFFLHKHSDDRNTPIFNQATFATAFEEWKCQDTEEGRPFRLCLVDVLDR